MNVRTPLHPRPVRRARLQSWLAFSSIAAMIAGAASCTKSSVDLNAPSGVKCNVTTATTLETAPALGGAGTVTITTNRECAWEASVNVNWIAWTSTSTGQGNGSVSFRVNANVDPTMRRGVLEINDSQVTVSQEPASCDFSVNPGTVSMGQAGGGATIGVGARAGCTWTASSSVDWITLGPTSGSGNGSVALAIAPTTAANRSGAVTIAGRTVTVNQGTAACGYTLTPPAQSVGTGGGSVTVAVAAGPTCAWAAQSNVPWITVTAGDAAGTGPDSVALNVAANTGPERTGTVTIGGQTFTITQAALVCSYALPTGGVDVAAGATDVVVAITAPTGCTWTAQSGANWLTISSGSSGNGAGEVVLAVASNGGAVRNGVVTIAGQTFTVHQAAVACNFGLSSTAQAVGAGGGNVAVNVTGPSVCNWTAQVAPNTPWLTISGSATGSGNGTVTLIAAANTGAARSGTATIGGRTFTVNQAAGQTPCTYTLSSPSQSVPATAGTAGVNVTAPAGCAWNAQVAANTPWLTLNNAVGNGNGAATLNVAANTGVARSGIVTVAGQTFTVNQAAGTVACNFSLSAPSQAVGAGAGTASVNVTAAAGCAWTSQVAPNTPWLTLAGSGAGNGPGAVTLNVAANTGVARSGTATIAGQTFTVNQAAVACSYSLTPATQTVGALIGTATITLTTGPTCAWTISENVNWLVLTGLPSGSGNRTFVYAATPNPGTTARTATVTAGGQSVTVTQQGR